MKYLLDQDACIKKEGTTSASRIFGANGLVIQDLDNYVGSFLVKVAKSGCMEKATLIMDLMTKTRIKTTKNQQMTRETNVNRKCNFLKRVELTAQERDYLDMSEEMKTVH